MKSNPIITKVKKITNQIKQKPLKSRIKITKRIIHQTIKPRSRRTIHQTTQPLKKNIKNQTNNKQKIRTKRNQETNQQQKEQKQAPPRT